MLDKVEPPSIPDGYAMSVAFSALLDLVRGITSMIEKELSKQEQEAAMREEAEPVSPPQTDSRPQEPSEFMSTSHVCLCALKDIIISEVFESLNLKYIWRTSL